MQQVRVVAHHDRQEPLLEAGLKQQLQQQGGHLQVQQQCFVICCPCVAVTTMMHFVDLIWLLKAEKTQKYSCNSNVGSCTCRVMQDRAW